MTINTGDPVLEGIGHTIDLDAHTYNKLEKLAPGQYFTNTFGDMKWQTDPTTLTVNRLYAYPFVVARKMTFDRIAVMVTTLAAGASARLGIYNSDADLKPSSLVLDAGEISVASTGLIAASINQQLAGGLYWLGLVTDGTPETYRYYLRPTPMGLDASLAWLCAVYVAHVYGALPDPFGAAGVSTSPNPVMFLRVASLD